MSHIKLQADSPGIFVFRAPTTVTLSVNRELVVIFQSTQPAATAIVIASDVTPTTDLEGWLSAAWLKLGNRPQTPIKLFGGTSQDARAVQTVSVWAREHQLSITAMDCGRSVLRTLQIDAEGQRVGVSYAESAEFLRTAFLAPGTAGQRVEAPPPHVALFLSANPVQRELAQQVVESMPGWTLEAPENATAFLRKSPPRKARWEIVIATEDVATLGRTWETWRGQFTARFPTASVWTSGVVAQRGKAESPAGNFPALTPETVAEFRSALALAPNWTPLNVRKKRKHAG